MPGRDQEPSIQLASGTTDERDGSYNISNTLGSIFYNTDTSNVEIRHKDPSNNVGWRDLVMNNKEQIDISGKLVVDGDVSFNGDLNMGLIVRKEVLLAGAGGLDGTGGAQGTARASSYFAGIGYAAPAAFNNSLTQYDSWYSKTSNNGIGTQGMPQSIEFEFPYNVIVTKYKIWPRNGSSINPKDWTLRAYPAGPYDRMYPPTRNLASASHTISGKTYGNGTYETNQSEIYSNNSIYGAWNAFNGIAESGVHFNNGYNSGSYNGSKYLVESDYKGDWLTIKLPVEINLTKYGFKIRSVHTNRAPGQYKIYGSNNGSTWTELVHKTSTITYNGNYFEERILESGMYNYFGLAVKQLSGSDSYLNFDEWYIYGNEYNPVEIDSSSNITNWPIPTTDSITNDTSFNEYPVANTTTAYRKFELHITDSGGNNYVTIGELAFYGYRPGTINTGMVTFPDGTSQTTAARTNTFSFKQYDGDDQEYNVTSGNAADKDPDGKGGLIDDYLTCFVTTVGGNYSGVSLDFSVAGEWQTQQENKGVAIARAKYDGTSYVYDKILRAAVSDINARIISPFTIVYQDNHSSTMDHCSGKYIDTDIAADSLYSYTVLLVSSLHPNTPGTTKFRLNRTITDATSVDYERGVSSITAQLFT